MLYTGTIFVVPAHANIFMLAESSPPSAPAYKA